MNRRRLYRCSHDQRISGVAAGVAEYFDLDPALVRILWVVSLVFTAGFSFLLYIVMAIVVPLEPDYMPAAGPWQPGNERWATGEGAPAGASGEAGTTGDAASGQPGSADATGSYTQSTWQGAPYPQAAWHNAPAHHGERRPGLFAPVFGVILILMGGAALLGQLFPGWNQAALWSLFFVGVGVVLVATSLRRRPAER